MDMTATVHELRELKVMREELDNRIATLEGIIKTEMTQRGTTSLMGGDWKVTWNTVNTQRLNQSLLKGRYPDIVKECTDVISYRRFLVK